MKLQMVKPDPTKLHEGALSHTKIKLTQTTAKDDYNSEKMQAIPIKSLTGSDINNFTLLCGT